MESKSNFKHFQKKKIVIANIFQKLQTVKDLFRQLCKKHDFRASFDGQQVKGSQTLLKSAWESFYYIFWSHWWEMILKISHLFNFEIKGVFVSTLTAN